MFELLHWHTQAVLYRSEVAGNARDALVEAHVRGADLSGADLRGADLYGADLRGAKLYGADLRGAKLRGAKLYGADLREAKLYGATLSGATLSGADLRRADLRGAKLYGATLSGADLRGAKLYGATGLLHNGTVPLQIFGTRLQIIVRESGHITIGCHHQTVTWWDEHYKAIATTEDYNNAEIAEYAAHIAHCKAWMEAHGVLEVQVETKTEAT